MGRIATAIISVFSSELDGLLAEYEAFKRRAAVMDFDDLLFTCREVLRRYPEVRAAAGEHFSRILVDEFQDTDPVQAEILFLLAGSDGSDGAWQERRLRPGQLFLVGDPKQAIYRFRGADLATYLTVRNAIEAQFPDNILRVTANFRSSRASSNISTAASRAARRATGGVCRAPRHERRRGSRLSVRRQSSVDLPPNTRNRHQPGRRGRVVAEICSRLIGNVELKLNDGGSRRLTPGDIALLAPVSTDLWRYERALEEAGLPFASQAGKNLFKRQEAQDLVALVRSIGRRADTLALGPFCEGPWWDSTEQDLLDITAKPPRRRPAAIVGLSLNTDPTIVQEVGARGTGHLARPSTPAARHHARAAARRSDRTASSARHRRGTQCGPGRPLAR